MATLKQENQARSGRLPEHGPIAENGREILLSLKNVDITFGKGDDAVRAVQDASFDIYKGETFSLVGESGSGKTTIGRAVIRVNPLANGEIDYKGVRFLRIKGKDGAVIQPNSLPSSAQFFHSLDDHSCRSFPLAPS